jgi:hypothetical protein
VLSRGGGLYRVCMDVAERQGRDGGLGVLYALGRSDYAEYGGIGSMNC